MNGRRTLNKYLMHRMSMRCLTGQQPARSGLFVFSRAGNRAAILFYS
jgi:hypothetical protein